MFEVSSLVVRGLPIHIYNILGIGIALRGLDRVYTLKLKISNGTKISFRFIISSMINDNNL